MVASAASALAGLRPGAPGPLGPSASPVSGPYPGTPSSSSSSTAVATAARPSTSRPTKAKAGFPPPPTTDSPGPSPSDDNSDDNDGDDGDDDDDEDSDVDEDDGSAQAAANGGGSGGGGGAAAAATPDTDTATASAAAGRQGMQHGAGGGGGSGHGGASPPVDAKKPRACEACRGLKVRCDMDPAAPPDTPCRRCARAGRRCVVTQPTRRRQKKTDSRVAELEKKIDALTASLQLTRQPAGGGLGGLHLGSLGNLGARGGTGTSPSRDDGPEGRNRPAPITASAGARHLLHVADLPHPSQSGPRAAAASAAAGGNRDLSAAAATGPAPPRGSNAPGASAGRGPFPTAPPPVVMAGQKRKFSEIREATGVVGAGAGSAGARTGLGSRAGSAVGDESPSLRDSPYQSHHPHHTQSQDPKQQQQQQQQQQPSPVGFTMAPSPASLGNGGGGGGNGSSGSSVRFGAEYGDLVDRGLLTMDKAIELFQRYTDQMAKHMPAVVFPAGTTAAEIRKTKPLLFLSLMAASTTEMPDVQRALVKELMQVFAEKVFVTGEKSLEVVQALQLAVIWYWPPEHFEELKFYQLVHTAAVMAIDIGLGKRRLGGPGAGPGPGFGGGFGAGLGGGLGAGLGADAARGRDHICGGIASLSSGAGGASAAGGTGRVGGPSSNWRDHPFKKYPLPDPCSIESRRAWLSCYFLTSNTAMALHRPNLVRWTSFMTECVEVLEKSPDAAPTDRYLCHLVWTHRLAEEVGQQFSMDDPTNVINIADPRTQYALRGFERELDRYKSTIPRSLLHPSLRLSFEVVSLYMHEIALQTENGNDDFKAPYTAESTKEALIGDATLTPAHIRALSACLLAIDGIFDAFLGMDIAALRCIPVFNFVRVAYATVVMIKLYLFASSPNSELGKVIDKEHLKVEQHLNALLDKFRATAAGNKSRPAGKFMIVLAMMRSWLLKQQAYNNSNPAESAGARNDAGQRTAADAAPAAAGAAAGGPASTRSAPGVAVSRPFSTLPGLSTATAAQPATPLAASGDSGNGSGNGSQEPRQQQQQQQKQQRQMQLQMQSPSAALYSSANTPLQLLSEIAANDYAATAATTAGVPPAAAGLQSIPPAWPPFYGSANDGGRSSGTGGNSGGGGGSGGNSGGGGGSGGSGGNSNIAAAAAGSQSAAGVAAPALMLPPPPPPPPTSADYMALYPNLNLGENFEYAMDLTFVGLSEGADNMNLTDGLQYILADPWFGGTMGPSFQF